MVYHKVNKKLYHTFNYGLIYYMGNYTQFSIQRPNSKSIGYVLAMVVQVYVAIMHECQRVHYRTYTCTNHGICLRYTMVVHVYVAIMHECQRVHYRTYTCTNHGISDLYHYNQPVSSSS